MPVFERKLWEAAPFGEAAREVEQMFGPQGNYEDYWLGTAYDRQDTRDWRSVEPVLRAIRDREVATWGPEEDTHQDLMGREFEGGGGLQHATPELGAVRAGLIRRGQLALDEEKRIADRIAKARAARAR